MAEGLENKVPDNILRDKSYLSLSSVFGKVYVIDKDVDITGIDLSKSLKKHYNLKNKIKIKEEVKDELAKRGASSSDSKIKVKNPLYDFVHWMDGKISFSPIKINDNGYSSISEAILDNRGKHIKLWTAFSMDYNSNLGVDYIRKAFQKSLEYGRIIADTALNGYIKQYENHIADHREFAIQTFTTRDKKAKDVSKRMINKHEKGATKSLSDSIKNLDYFRVFKDFLSISFGMPIENFEQYKELKKEEIKLFTLTQGSNEMFFLQENKKHISIFTGFGYQGQEERINLARHTGFSLMEIIDAVTL